MKQLFLGVDIQSCSTFSFNYISSTFSFQTYFPAYAQIADICNSKENDEQARIKNALQLLCLLLPDENRIVLENLINRKLKCFSRI